ncbi:hypothetical protein [Defluviicoccus vanus]|uniref:Uncharacterized protein n=1 Tax=Defluviicoccus vanus TaxID=111831 RepID=A0A7H1N4B9_9PROT|nr:hypothetical protein [Defluviicoccus vanus]QNT70555.1 hypothetical protein HQ394_16005 [Defluviicoccus vanus]
MDAVTLFAIAVFSLAWLFYARSDASEPLIRLFCAVLMILASGVGLLGLALRWLTHS